MGDESGRMGEVSEIKMKQIYVMSKIFNSILWSHRNTFRYPEYIYAIYAICIENVE